MSFHNKTARSDMGAVIVVMNVRTKCESWGLVERTSSTRTQLSSGSHQLKYGHGPVWMQSINQYLFLATTPQDFLSKKGFK